VPVRSKGDQDFGSFVLCSNGGGGFNEREAALARVIAAQAAFALERMHETERLQQLIEAGRETARLKDEFVAMVMHELRSPLTAIVGATHILSSGQCDDFERIVGMIERNARAQNRLVDDLVHLAQVDMGKVDLQITKFDLVTILAQTVEEIRLTPSAEHTAILEDFPQHLPVRGDPQRLRQVFWNLFSNALRFTFNGEIRVRAVLDAGFAKVTVRDNGPGIAEDELPYLFDRFRQGHSLGLKWHVGLGVGLAIVKEFVSMHGGTVAAESGGLGKGATFTVRLPIHSEQ
jgi:signal transduction histidine kinase